MIEPLIAHLRQIICDATGLALTIQPVYEGEGWDHVYAFKTSNDTPYESMKVIRDWFLLFHPNLIHTWWDATHEGTLAPIDYMAPTQEAPAGAFMFHLQDLPAILHALDPHNTAIDEQIQIRVTELLRSPARVDRAKGQTYITSTARALTKAERKLLMGCGFSVGSTTDKTVVSVIDQQLDDVENRIKHSLSKEPIGSDAMIPFANHSLPPNDLTIYREGDEFSLSAHTLFKTDKGNFTGYEYARVLEHTCHVYLTTYPALFRLLGMGDVPLYIKLAIAIAENPDPFTFSATDSPGESFMKKVQHPITRKGCLVPYCIGMIGEGHHIAQAWDPDAVTADQAYSAFNKLMLASFSGTQAPKPEQPDAIAYRTRSKLKL